MPLQQHTLLSKATWVLACTLPISQDYHLLCLKMLYTSAGCMDLCTQQVSARAHISVELQIRHTPPFPFSHSSTT